MDKPKIASKQPFLMDVEPGTYAWCACGYSDNQPFCDGSHKATSFKPVVEKIDKPKKIAWCGCKHTRTAPFCDGTHKEINT